MTAGTSRRTQLAAVWLLHQEGRRAAGHAEAARAWAEQDARRDHRGYLTTDWFNPVEINIGLMDIGTAACKWERVAGIEDVCYVQIHDRRPGDRRNEMYTDTAAGDIDTATCRTLQRLHGWPAVHYTMALAITGTRA